MCHITKGVNAEADAEDGGKVRDLSRAGDVVHAGRPDLSGRLRWPFSTHGASRMAARRWPTLLARLDSLTAVAPYVLATCAVVVFGAVEEHVLAPIEAGIFCLGIAALARRLLVGESAVKCHPTLVPLLGVIGLGFVQLLPLPAELVRALSPASSSLRADLPGPIQFQTLSVYPYATQLALLRLGTYAVFFALAYEATSSAARVRTALRWAAGLGTCVALYGLFNYLAGNDSLLWHARRHYLGSATGTYVNRNHFAALMVLLLPTLLAAQRLGRARVSPQLSGGERTARATFFLLCGAIMGLALLFSQSRGGITSALVTFGGFALALRRFGGRRTRSSALLPAAFATIVVAWGALIGMDGVAERFYRLFAGMDGTGGRASQWADTLRIVLDFPIFGSGLGTYAFLYPSYKTTPTQAVFHHAHNDYLQMLADGGIIGLLLLGWLAVRVARAIARVGTPPQGEAALIVWALSAGIAGVLLHSLVDFCLQIPGNVLVMLAVTAVAIRIAEDPTLVTERPSPLRAPGSRAAETGAERDSER